MFKNCTPHVIRFQFADGTVWVFPPSGELARVSTVEIITGTINGMPVVRRAFGDVHLPEVPCETVDGNPVVGFLLVSSLVLEAAKAQGLADYLLAPDTGPTAVRQGGQVVAVTRWVTA